jgi:hypothetical protein
MKKIYTIALLFLSTVAFSQSELSKMVIKRTVNLPSFSGESAVRTITDTLGIGVTATAFTALPIFASISSQALLLQYVGGGFAYGVNVSPSNLNEIAQGYELLGPAGVEEVLMWFAGKTAGAAHTSASSFNVRVYAITPNAANNINPSNFSVIPFPGPSTVLASQPFLFDNIDTALFSFNVVTFPATIPVGTDFAVGAEFNQLKNTYHDTIGFLCDNVGDAQGFDFAFHKSGNQWYVSDAIFSGYTSGPGTGLLDNDIAIFPVIDNAFVGINDNSYLSGIKMSAYPNPAANHVTISFGVNKDSFTKLELFDSRGRKIIEKEIGSVSAGKIQEVNLDVSTLPSGNYYYSVAGNQGRMIKKLEICK